MSIKDKKTPFSHSFAWSFFDRLGLISQNYPITSDLRHIKLLTALQLFYIVLWIIYVVFYQAIGSTILLVLCFIGMISTLISMWVSLRLKRQYAGAIMMVTGGHITLFAFALCTGGLSSPSFVWLVGNGASAFLVLSGKGAAYLNASTIVALLVTVILEGTGVVFGNYLPFSPESAAYDLFMLTTMWLIVLALSGMTFIYAYLFNKGRAESESASRVKSEFLATVSHEIRTPLNGVMGMVTLLQHSELSTEQEEYLEMIRVSSNGLLKMINNILDFSKLEAEKMSIDHEPFLLDDLTSELEGLFRAILDAKGLEFKFSRAKDFPAAFVGDKEKIKQILVNLIGNAIKFTIQGGIYTEISYAEDGTVHFSVRDTGIGIATGHDKEVFAPFQQEDSSTTRHFGGTGLGLAISRKLVELMGGVIEFSSQKGEGTTFRFMIPMEEAPIDISDNLNKRRVSTPLFRFSKRHSVLLAEDNRINQMVAQKLLDTCNCEVQVAVNGMQALAMIKEKPYDIILMDLHMPVLDGVACTKKIREEEHMQQEFPVPIVAVTATISEDEHKRCIDSGMQSVLTKPYTYDGLVHVLREYLVD